MKHLKLTLASLLLIAGVHYSFACTNLIVTKGASKDGSVMVSYAADNSSRYGTLVYYPAGKYKPGTMTPVIQWGRERLLGEIPQAPYTYGVMGNMNEHQLVIGETTFGGREEMVDSTAILDYGSIIYFTLQRAKTAREAIKVYTDLANKYGYWSSGESISIADPNEAWILEIISKKQKMEWVDGKRINVNRGVLWVAVRIPDGYISAHANCARIATFPLNDPENCLYAPDLISQAREMGLYEGKDEDFSFADTFCPLDFFALRACEARVWSFFNKHGDFDSNKYLDFASGHNPKNRMPLYVKPKAKLSVKDLADMMRDHYEGTPFDMTKDVGAGGNELPYRWRPMSYQVDSVKYIHERAIATQQTGFWFVGQCRSWLPNEVGGVLWFAVDDAGTSPLTPVYCSSTKVSEHYAYGNGSMLKYSPTSMFWMVNRIAHFSYLRYNHIGAEVRSVIDTHENEMITKEENYSKSIANMFGEKANLSPKERKTMVKKATEFSLNEANALFSKWDALDKYLLLKYLDGGTRVQNEDGSFKDNGWSKNIPANAKGPGYTEKFLRAIVNDTGDKLKNK